MNGEWNLWVGSLDGDLGVDEVGVSFGFLGETLLLGWIWLLAGLGCWRCWSWLVAAWFSLLDWFFAVSWLVGWFRNGLIWLGLGGAIVNIHINVDICWLLIVSTC